MFSGRACLVLWFLRDKSDNEHHDLSCRRVLLSPERLSLLRLIPLNRRRYSFSWHPFHLLLTGRLRLYSGLLSSIHHLRPSQHPRLSLKTRLPRSPELVQGQPTWRKGKQGKRERDDLTLPVDLSDTCQKHDTAARGEEGEKCALSISAPSPSPRVT